jgi:hypothetical protein
MRRSNSALSATITGLPDIDSAAISGDSTKGERAPAASAKASAL